MPNIFPSSSLNQSNATVKRIQNKIIIYFIYKQFVFYFWKLHNLLYIESRKSF